MLIAAFKAALLVPGCDGIEFDVRRSADGVPGGDPRRHTCPRAAILKTRAARLSAAAPQRHGVPALAEVCAAVGVEPFLDVELKEWVPGSDRRIGRRPAGQPWNVLQCR